MTVAAQSDGTEPQTLNRLMGITRRRRVANDARKHLDRLDMLGFLVGRLWLVFTAHGSPDER